MLEAIRYKRGSLSLLDQTQLPLHHVWLDIATAAQGREAIIKMVVRGAPAIAITAALSLAVELANLKQHLLTHSLSELVRFIEERLQLLRDARPTAVNLSQATDALRDLTTKTAEQQSSSSNTNDAIVEAIIATAEDMLRIDVAANRAMGEFGAVALERAVLDRKPDSTARALNVLTHCNTGSLATAGYGTALGVIRSLFASTKLERAYCTETRPYNQGGRLTATELVEDGIPATLITDSMAAALMRSGKVDAVVVGADRIVANGDTANKIGTYSLAVLASFHGIPFFIAAPRSTLDMVTETGDQIVIEQRSPTEVTHMNGVQITPHGIHVWNPAFDVTPYSLISGIITEVGVISRAPDAPFDVRGFVARHANDE